MTTFTGSGRGAQTRDGCSVEFYRELPYMGELDAIRHLLPAGACVLELGCGTGRLTRVLLDAGLVPTCVDNSAEMLACLPEGARAIHADIESLALAETFDVILLASFLINHPDEEIRRAFVRCAARHANESARILIQRHDPDWLRSVASDFKSSVGRLTVRVEHVRRDESAVAMTLAFSLSDEVWRQSFAAVPLEQEQIDSLLAEEGLRTVESVGPRGLWTIARQSAHA
jgi:SAM-dependent methyltransferase